MNGKRMEIDWKNFSDLVHRRDLSFLCSSHRLGKNLKTHIFATDPIQGVLSKYAHRFCIESAAFPSDHFFRCIFGGLKNLNQS